MENNAFYIKYKDNPVEINTHYNTERTALRLLPLKTVCHLIQAFFPNTPPNELGQYSLHLPDSITRSASALGEDCFAPTDSTGTSLRNGLALTLLLENGFGFDDLQPLIIKSKNDTVQDIDSLTVGNNGVNWVVSGSISDSLQVKGVRSRMYRNADNYLGYSEAGKIAFFYEGTTLRINVLFKSEDNALRFDSHLRNESITINSPMNSLTINADVSTTSTAQLGARIYYKDYIPTDSESPQDTHSVITIQISTVEETSDEFFNIKELKSSRNLVPWEKQKAVT